MDPLDFERSDSGQALTEFLGSLGILALVFSGSSWVIYQEWNWTHCSILLFEKLHAKNTNTPDPYPSARVLITTQDFDTTVRGEALCGSTRQTLSLPRLENAQW